MCRGVPPMTGKQRRHLRGLAHGLQPVVLIGQRGATEGVVRQVDRALHDHELIKVKVGRESPDDADEVAVRLRTATGCEVAGHVGRILILYRRRAEHPTVHLPGDEPPAE
jgi:RNA-binding protein